jgi:hypothetical protein
VLKSYSAPSDGDRSNHERGGDVRGDVDPLAQQPRGREDR